MKTTRNELGKVLHYYLELGEVRNLVHLKRLKKHDSRNLTGLALENNQTFIFDSYCPSEYITEERS